MGLENGNGTGKWCSGLGVQICICVAHVASLLVVSVFNKEKNQRKLLRLLYAHLDNFVIDIIKYDFPFLTFLIALATPPPSKRLHLI
jgi:hypothetical protein